MSYYGPEHWDQSDFDRLDRKSGWLRNISNLNTAEADTIDAQTSLAYAHQHATDADAKATSADKKLDQVLEALGKLSPPA
jgi:hypothetical protein